MKRDESYYYYLLLQMYNAKSKNNWEIEPLLRNLLKKEFKKLLEKRNGL